MKKNNAGITLVSLVITVIVLLILASIAVYSGVSTIRSARLTKFTTELKMMQQKVNELYDSYINNKSVTVNGVEYVGQGEYTTQNTEDGQTQTVQTKLGIQDIGKDPEGLFNSNRLEEVFSAEGSGITDRTGYMYYDIGTLQALGLDDMEYEFFVNVATRSVVSIEGFNDYGTRYYTLNQVPNGVYNVDYIGNGAVNFETTSEVVNGEGKIYIKNITATGYVNKWQVRYRIKAEEGENENTWTTTEEFTGNEYTIDVPIENLLENYEIQIFHGDEIASEIKTAHVLQVGDYIDYDPTNVGTITTTYTSPQGTYHVDQAAMIADTSENMTEGNGYADQTFSVSANTNGWRVLGIDEETDEILLISADIVETTDNGNFYLRGQTGAEWGVKELNDICAIYGEGKGASRARSINVDDINKITGYDPDMAQCFDGQIYEYGNEVTYTKNASNISYQDTLNNKSGTFSSSTIFRYYDEGSKLWKTLTQGDNIKLRSTEYYYYPNTLTTSSSGNTVGISTDSSEYEILFERKEYWLASPYVFTNSSYAYFGLRGVFDSHVSRYRLFYSNCNADDNTDCGVRPIVSLESNINISGGDGSSLDTAYQIQ